MSSTVGSGTRIGWNRRASAASFSMFLRYSSSVVAPTMCSSPRASAGLSMLPASIPPSLLPPAPTRVCSSSMKMIRSSRCSRISSMIRLTRSSKSPRYRVPATTPDSSSCTTRLPDSVWGTSSSTMRCARPSTIAVLPTPASPIRTGLFLPRRDSTSMVCSISSSRPMTGSIRPSRAMAVRSRPNSSSVGVADRPPGPPGPLAPGGPPWPARTRCSVSGVTPAAASSRPAPDSGLAARANRMCSGPM